jgi:crossover junction endodeoxyribonuclease RusA
MTIITLPWMPAKLSSNNRSHWRFKAALTARCRGQAHYAALAAGVSSPEGNGDIEIIITFNPPSNRGDRLNYPAHGGLKAYIDGIADAMKVNDKRFIPAYFYGEKVKGGKLTVEIINAS